MDHYIENRTFMKSIFGTDFASNQSKGVPQPPLTKPYDAAENILDLPKVSKEIVKKPDVYDCILDRKSHRVYQKDSLTLEELSYLLWMTQGVKEIKGNSYATMRPVPSGGARHPFETYLAVQKVEGLEPGFYRYLPMEHKLLFLRHEEDLSQKMTDSTLGQKFIGAAPVTFIWSCIPYRGEWRYVNRSHKVMLLDAGHLCHALYLACESLGLGTCAIAAYDQEGMDALIGVDGTEEYVIYLAPVGRV